MNDRNTLTNPDSPTVGSPSTEDIPNDLADVSSVEGDTNAFVGKQRPPVAHYVQSVNP